MVGWILKKILGSKNHREVRRMAPMVRRINELDAEYSAWADDKLRAKTAAWKEELSKRESLEEAFAIVKNAARRLKDRGHEFTVCVSLISSGT
jgi:preprotein translocase subunit SecA